MSFISNFVIFACSPVLLAAARNSQSARVPLFLSPLKQQCIIVLQSFSWFTSAVNGSCVVW